MTRRLLAVLLTTFCAAAPAVAQQTGSIKGVVKDETDASLPGATVTASGPATRTVVSGGDGAYQIANLPPGFSRGVFVMMFTTPVRALAPQTTDAGPRTTSICLMSAVLVGTKSQRIRPKKSR